MFEQLLKTAEPPPPEGVSSKEWDRILQKGPTEAQTSRFRKSAAELLGKQAFEEVTTPVETGPAAYELMWQAKVASASQPRFLWAARRLRPNLEEAVALYERWGGGYNG